MKTKSSFSFSLVLLGIILFSVITSQAQEIANFRRVAIVSPEIGEKTVTFRISAPKAKLVRLFGSWMKSSDSSTNMLKDSLGTWSVSITKPNAELYTYHFIVDGMNVNDVNNIFLQRDGVRYLSVLLVPGEQTATYSEANQRGNLKKVWYESPTIGSNRH